MRRGGYIAAALTAGLLVFACSEKTPSRDYIPVLRRRLFELQEAVKARNTARIDSLLSVDALSLRMTSDSLLRFVYGPDDDFAFVQFGGAQYVYTNKVANVRCYIMDTTGRRDRPVTFTFVHQYDLWLLKRFDPGKPDEPADTGTEPS